MGFVATRPDQELGEGPDVLWVNERTGAAIAFEMKIENTSSYAKKEIGQSHNHVQWMKDKQKRVRLLGLAIVGDCERGDPAASPSDQMVLVKKENVKKVTTKVRDLLLKIEVQTPLERRGSISALKDKTDFEIEKVWAILGR